MAQHHPYGVLDRDHLHKVLLPDLGRYWHAGVVSQMK